MNNFLFEVHNEQKDITCNCCNQVFTPGNDEQGWPNGIGFELEDGTLFNICKACLIKQGVVIDNGR